MKKTNLYRLLISIPLLCIQPNVHAHEVQFSRATLPVLAGEEYNHVGRLMIIRSGNNPDYIDGLDYSLEGSTEIRDIQSVALYAASKQGRADKNRQIAFTNIDQTKGHIRLNIPLTADTSYFAFTIRLREKVQLDHRINLNCTKVIFASGSCQPSSSFKKGLRIGIALRKQGQDGVHTSRIPGLTTSPKGTLLAIYDARWESGRDLQGDVDIALNRSTDGGQTWEPMQRVLDQHEWGDLPEKFNGVSDACILCDERTGDLYVAGLWMHGVLDGKTGKWAEGLTRESKQWIHQWISKGSQPGTDVKETSQFLITKSTDDGKTWSEPFNITPTTKNPEWWLYAPAPGHGITLKDGTLVFPSQGRDKEGKPFSNITYSRDGGKTWTASNPAYHNTTECMAVELDNEQIMLNMRDNRNRGKKHPNGRRICITSDMGKTWTEHPTSYSVLTEPTCMASLHKHQYKHKGQKQTVLAFFNPDSYKTRDRLTLKLSMDNGNSWPEKYQLMLDEWGGAGYSCITSIDNNTLGIVYEGSGAHLIFQQIRLDELIEP